MKKKPLRSDGEASPGQRAADYVVGQVSGSLFQKNSAASGSLSALFGAAAPAPQQLFQPAPEPAPKCVEEQEPRDATPEVKGQSGPKKRKQPKEKSAADQKLEDRESALQNADEEEERGRAAPAAKKKKKEAAAANEAEQWVLRRQTQRARKQEEAAKAARTVFVGNLPISCTKKSLRSLFRDTGSIESIRFRSVVREDPSMSRKVAAIKRQAHPKKQSMNAYVVFKDEGGVAKALERNGVEIQHDFHIRVDKVAASASHDHKRSVFVGNLPFETTEAAFRRHFEECGGVEAVRLVRDKNSGLGKGFGYVLFESADSVQLALELSGSKLEGRAIRVKRSVKKEKQKKDDDRRGAAEKGPTRGPARGPGRVKPVGLGGFKSPKKFPGNRQQPSKSFKGEMADPSKKAKKKTQKKKVKPRKAVHI